MKAFLQSAHSGGACKLSPQGGQDSLHGEEVSGAPHTGPGEGVKAESEGLTCAGSSTQEGAHMGEGLSEALAWS